MSTRPDSSRMPPGRRVISAGGTAVVLAAAIFSLAACEKAGRATHPDSTTIRLLKQGEEALAAHDFEGALALADSAARRSPDAVEPDFLRGLIYSHVMRWDDAERAYRRVIDRDSDYRGAWNNLGNIALRQARFREALSHFRRELGAHPASPPWHSIGRAYAELELVDSAAAAFQKAVELDSSNVSAAVAYVELLQRDGENARALAIMERALRRAPDDREVRALVGALLLKLGRVEDAVPHLEAVATALPWHTEAHYKLALAYRQLGREEESQRMLDQAEKLSARQAEITMHQKGTGTNPDDPYAHAALATAYRMAGRHNEALRAYNIALWLEPENVEFLNNVAALHFLREDTASAILTYRYILEREPERPEIWLNLGILYALSGDASNARTAWEEVLRQEPENTMAPRYLARLDS